jgi:putative membrane protein
MLLLIGCGIAWTSQASDPTDTQNASKAFVNKASMSSLFEIKAAEIALTRSETPQVRQVAEKLIQDHKESSEKLRTLLLRENLKLDPSMDLDSEHFEKLKK